MQAQLLQSSFLSQGWPIAGTISSRDSHSGAENKLMLLVSLKSVVKNTVIFNWPIYANAVFYILIRYS